jgi:myo-inositol-1(or 4)-monophosphatase
MRDATLLDLLHEAAAAVQRALGDVADWGPEGTRPGEDHVRYHSDLAADRAAVDVLTAAGVSVVSEESGLHRAEGRHGGIVVVVDPLDGSTNASLGIPWYAASLCAVDADGARAALVLDLPHDLRYVAARGDGARRDGVPIRPSGCTTLSGAVVGLSGMPPRHLGWRQMRALGAASLDLCAVASGALDAWADCTADAHGPWDYLGGALVCREAGAAVADVDGRPLDVADHAARRTPVAAATPELLAQLVPALKG